MIKVLVVDDSALMRRLLGQALAGEADMETAFARDGIEALALAHTFAPDVVTLDVHMPLLDGLGCLDRLMLERPCPVVMVSSLTAAGADATLEALRLGAVDFVSKPQGAVALHMDEWGPMLVAKVRSAAGAKLRSSLRLTDRVRHRMRARPRSAGLPPLMSSIDAGTPDAPEPAPPPLAGIGQGVVLVGTSTGGPPALEALLTALPADFPWPLVVAQHMPASFTGPLARRLDRLCAITVTEVVAPTVLAPGHAYIGRGDADVVVSRRKTAVLAMAAPSVPGYPWHPSVDRLVRTAMDHVPAAQIIGVLMTGMGNDGAAAMTLLRGRGGRTIAEAEESAVVWGMPGELVKAGGADAVLPLAHIAAHLQTLTP